MIYILMGLFWHITAMYVIFTGDISGILAGIGMIVFYWFYFYKNRDFYKKLVKGESPVLTLRGMTDLVRSGAPIQSVFVCTYEDSKGIPELTAVQDTLDTLHGKGTEVDFSSVLVKGGIKSRLFVPIIIILFNDGTHKCLILSSGITKGVRLFMDLCKEKGVTLHDHVSDREKVPLNLLERIGIYILVIILSVVLITFGYAWLTA